MRLVFGCNGSGFRAKDFEVASAWVTPKKAASNLIRYVAHPDSSSEMPELLRAICLAHNTPPKIAEDALPLDPLQDAGAHCELA